MCPKKKDKMWLKQTGYHITIKRNGQKNSQMIKVQFKMVYTEAATRDVL